MKTLILVVLFAATALGEPMRDGIYWQTLNGVEKEMWATGWMDGLMTGKAFPPSAEFMTLVHSLQGLNSAELCKGLNQLYEADYRNLRIGMQEGALFVARYSRTGMSGRDAAAELIAMRERYKGAH
jgi:hypothetical protein